MIISSCPTRISLGSADHLPYSERYGGIALNIAIQKRVYVIIRQRNKLEQFKFRVSYSHTETCNEINEIQLPIAREALNMLNITEPLEIIYSADVPTQLGLGTSSSFALAVIKGLYKIKGLSISNELLAEKAYRLEREILNEVGGFQDQYSCFGGINYLTGSPYNVKRETIRMNPDKAKNLEDHMLLIYTGVQTNSHDILQEQLAKLKKGDTIETTSKIKTLVEEMYAIMCMPDFLPLYLTHLLREAWELKKKLSSSMSSPIIRDIEHLILDIAPYAGYRLVGSGGGRGLMLVILKPEDRDILIRNSGQFKTAKIKIDWEGSKITNTDHGWC